MAAIPSHRGSDSLHICRLIDSFFLKSSLLICSVVSQKDAMMSPEFTEEWFRSPSTATYSLPDIIHKWTAFDGGGEPLPPLVIEVFLDLRDLTASQVVRLQDADGNLWNVCSGTKKTEIMMERWLIELDSESNTFHSHEETHGSDNNNDEGGNSAGQLVLLLRYLHTLVQLLPLHDLVKQQQEYAGSYEHAHSATDRVLPTIGARIVDGSKPILSKGRIGLSKPLLGTYANIINDTNMPPHLEQKKITPVWTKYGLLRVSVSYRRDCKFVIEDTDAPHIPGGSTTDTGPGPGALASLKKVRDAGSLSPRSRGNTLAQQFDKGNRSSSNHNSFSQRKSISISRQVQPFKVGSVNSAVMNMQNASQGSSRNPSNSSFLTPGPGRKTSNGSANQISQTNLHPGANNLSMDGTSVDSGSKYMSSFGNLRRHSSINKNHDAIAIERKHLNLQKTKSNQQQQSTSPKSTEDILNFVKQLDERPEIKGKLQRQRHNSSSINSISASLLKFQNLRPGNDMLSEDLSMSVSMHQPQGQPLAVDTLLQTGRAPTDTPGSSLSPHVQHGPRAISGGANAAARRRSSSISHSHSPLPNFSGSAPYPSIPSKLIGEGSESPHAFQVGEPMKKLQSEDDTTDPGVRIGAQLPGSINVPAYNFYSRKNSITEENEDADELLAIPPTAPRYGTHHMDTLPSSSPKSLESISSSFSKNMLPYRQQYQYLSQPAIVTTAVQANLHKPEIHSTDILEDQNRVMRKGSATAAEVKDTQKNMIKGMSHRKRSGDAIADSANDDDEMVFFMSDMNLSHE